MRLTGKVALVTGSAQGIGAAICRRFVEEGAAVIAADSNEELGAALAGELTSTGAECTFHRLDVRSERDWTAAMGLTTQRHGRLDVLVNNAGIDIPGDIEQATLDDWRTTFGVNVESLLLGTRLAVSSMKAARQGSIVNIASIASLVGTPGGAAYCASKGAVLALTRSVALHCAARGYGIRVNAIHPGPVRTPMVMKYASENPQFLAGMQAAIPLGTLGDPMDIANGALYFASDESKWVTGTSLVIDGGYTAQ